MAAFQHKYMIINEKVKKTHFVSITFHEVVYMCVYMFQWRDGLCEN